MSNGMELKVRRIRAKVTQEQIAGVVGLSRSWVAKVEAQEFLPPETTARYVAALRTFADVGRVA